MQKEPPQLLPGSKSDTSNPDALESVSEEQKVSNNFIEIAFSMRSFVHELKNQKLVTESVANNKLLWVLEIDRLQGNIPLKYMDPASKIVRQYQDHLFSRVPSRSEEQLRKSNLKKEELLDCMLDPDHYNQSIFTLVVDTYMWYMTDKELFSYLLAKYCAVPLNLTTAEIIRFEESILKNTRLKILLFMTEWYKKYRDLVLTVEALQAMFSEVLLIMFVETKDKKWIREKFQLLLGFSNKETFKKDLMDRFSELVNREKRINENITRLQENDDTRLEKYEAFFTMLKHESRRLAEQICLFDFDNFQLLLPNELLITNWSRDKKKTLAPNVMYISESFNRLSRLLTLHVILSKDKKELVKRTDDIIQLSDNLRHLNNFNSAYAVHLAISNVWLKNYMEAAEVTISSRAKEAFDKQKATFSVNNGQYKLQQEQFRATYPTIPFLGLYVQQILVVCERKSTFDSSNNINLDKFCDLEKILQKIITTKNYPYENFRGVPKIQDLLRNLPPTAKTEDQIKKKFELLIQKYENK